MKPTLKILHLEDNTLDSELVAATLANEGIDCEVIQVHDKESFIAKLKDKPDLILADFNLPTFSGNDALTITKKTCPDTPFLLVSGALGEERAIDLMKQGITDYVMKHRLGRLGVAVRRALKESEEITYRRLAEAERERLHHELENAFLKTHEIAFTDKLTGLPNQNALWQYIKSFKDHTKEFDFLLLNLDGFRHINYRTRYEIGDAVLKAVANRIQKTLSPEVQFGRLSGDSFVAIIAQNGQSTEKICQVILQELSNPIEVNEHEFLLTGTASIVHYPTDGENGNDLLRTAELNLRNAKKEGGNKVKRFSDTDRSGLDQRVALENALLEKNLTDDLYLVFQPKQNLISQRVESLEALVRWESPVFGPQSPMKFIPIAEELGVITSISEWILKTGLQMLEEMDRLNHQPISLAVNLSPVHIKRPDFLDDLFRLFETHQIAPGRIEFEITEGLLLEDSHKVAELLKTLRSAGFRIALDDFGTGFSNLSYLSKYPVDTLKIDRSFITDIHLNARNRDIVKAMIILAKAVGGSTVAEGVEVQEEYDTIKDIGCDFVQGFFFSKPLRKDDLFSFLPQ